MPNDILLYVGSAIITIWGAAYIALVMRAAARSGDASRSNHMLMRMEWFAEGILLVFIGIMTAALNWWYGSHNAVVIAVYRISALMLIGAAAWHAIGRARAAMLPVKLSPVVLVSGSLLFILGMFFGVPNIL
jgi:hypothetical protein